MLYRYAADVALGFRTSVLFPKVFQPKSLVFGKRMSSRIRHFGKARERKKAGMLGKRLGDLF